MPEKGRAGWERKVNRLEEDVLQTEMGKVAMSPCSLQFFFFECFRLRSVIQSAVDKQLGTFYRAGA